MSKRKRSSKMSETPASKATAEDAGDDASVKDDMVHVTPDLLSGSPDIFAPRKSGATTSEPAFEAAADGEPEMAAETAPVETATDSLVDAAEPAGEVEPTEANTTLAHEGDVEPAPPFEPPPPPAYIPAPPHALAPAHQHRAGTSMALGVVLVVLGVFALGIVGFGIDLTQYGWPLFVILPGLTLLVIGFVGLGAGASIPGGIVTMLGLVLAYQNYSDDWPSWAFAWALVVPFGVGLGMYMQALRDRDMPALRRGRTLMFAGVLIFLIGFVFFESILGISGRDYGGLGKAGLPVLLIVIGLILLVRSIQRSRRPKA